MSTGPRYVDNRQPDQGDAASVNVVNSPAGIGPRLVLHSPTKGVCLGGGQTVLWSKDGAQGHATATTWPLGTTVADVAMGLPEGLFPADARMVEVLATGFNNRAIPDDCAAAGLERWEATVRMGGVRRA